MKVTDLAAGLLRDFIDVLANPGQVIKRRLVIDGNNGDVTRAGIGWFLN